MYQLIIKIHSNRTVFMSLITMMRHYINKSYLMILN